MLRSCCEAARHNRLGEGWILGHDLGMGRHVAHPGKGAEDELRSRWCQSRPTP